MWNCKIYFVFLRNCCFVAFYCSLFLQVYWNLLIASIILNSIIRFECRLNYFYFITVSVNWNDAQLGLAKDIDSSLYAQFGEYFDYTFLDVTGFYNLAANLSCSSFNCIKDAAKSAIVKLNSFKDFDLLFVKEMPFTNYFDIYIRYLLN